jgi:hypothetical protein
LLVLFNSSPEVTFQITLVQYPNLPSVICFT